MRESITIANFTLTNNITNPNVFALSDGQMMFIKFQKSKWDRIQSIFITALSLQEI